MPINPANDDIFAGLGVEDGGLYDQAVDFLRPARAFFGASQNVGGQLVGEILGEDLYKKALARSLKGRGVTGDDSDLKIAEALPGAGDVLAEAVPEEVQANPFYRAAGEPILRLGGNLVGDPTNLIGAGAINKGFGMLGAAAFAPDIVKGGVEGVEAIGRGIEQGDLPGAVGGGVQTTLSAGLAYLVARGMIHPDQARKAKLREASEKGDLNAREVLRQEEASTPRPEEPFFVSEPQPEGYPAGGPQDLGLMFPGEDTLTPLRQPEDAVGANFQARRQAVDEGRAAAEARIVAEIERLKGELAALDAEAKVPEIPSNEMVPVEPETPITEQDVLAEIERKKAELAATNTGYPRGAEVQLPPSEAVTPTGAEIEGIGARFQSKRAAAEGLDAAAQARDAKIKAKMAEKAAAQTAPVVETPPPPAPPAEPPAPPTLTPAPPKTMAPAAEQSIAAIKGDPIKEDLLEQFYKLQEQAVASWGKRAGADLVTLEKAAGDSFLEAVASFKPSEEALQLWHLGNKSRLYQEFKQFAKGNFSRRLKDAFSKKSKATVPDVAPAEGGKAPSELVATPEAPAEAPPSLTEQAQNAPQGDAGKVEEIVKRSVDPEKSVQENAGKIINAIAKELPHLFEKALKNPGKAGDVAGEGFKNKAWNAWALKQAQPTLQNKEIAALLGVNKTQISKYLAAVNEALGTVASKAKALDKAATKIKFQGSFTAGDTPGNFLWKGPAGKTAKVFRNEKGGISFQVDGQLDLSAALDGIGLTLQHPDVFSGHIDLSDLKKTDLDDLIKAGFVKAEGDAWKVQLDSLKNLQGGLGFVPSPRLAELIKEIGSRGVEAVRRGAELLIKGADAAGVWASRMIREFGEGIKKHLGKIYNEVKGAIKSFSFGELPNEPSGPTASAFGAGQFGEILKNMGMFKGAPKNVEAKAEQLVGEAAEIGLKAGRETPPGSPSGVVSTGEKLPPGISKQPAINEAHNTYRMALSKEADNIAVKVMEHLNPMMNRAKKQSEKDWLREGARLLGLVDGDSFVMHMSKFPAAKPEELIALRQLAKQAWERMRTAKDNLLTASVSGDAEKEAAAARAYFEAARDGMVGGSVAGNMGSHVGRLLRSYGVILQMDPKNYKTNKFIDALRELGLKKEQAEHLFNLWQTGQHEQFIKGIHLASEPDALKMGLEAWKGALLTPASHLANTGSNVAMYMLRGRERSLAAGLDKLRTMVLGGERAIYRMPGDIGWAAAQEAMATAWPKFLDDLENSFKAKPLKVTSPADIRQAATALPPTRLGEFLKFNFKLLDAADSVGKLASMYRNSAIFAWTEAMNKAGGKVKDARELYPKFYDEMKAFLRAEQGVPGAEHLDYKAWNVGKLKTKAERVLSLMDQDTFKEELTGALRSFAHGINDSLLFSIVAPFVKTPINIARETVRRTPIGLWMLGRKIHRAKTALPFEARAGRSWWEQIQAAAKKIGPEEIEDDLAKTIAGTVGGYVVLNALGNHLTGGGPSDPKKQEQLKRTGWQPYSVRVGNQYVSYQRFEPISAVVGMAADINEGIRYGEFEKLPKMSQRLVATLTENLTNKTFMAGMEGLFTMWSDPQRYADRWVKQLQGSAVPNTIGYLPFGVLARAADPTFRQTEAFTADPFMAKIPGLSQKLPPQIGPTGEDRERGETFIERLASPVRRNVVKNDPEAAVAAEADRVGYVMSAPKRYQAYGNKKVDYTQEELKAFTNAQQQAIQRMTNLLKDPSYLALPDNEEDPRWTYGRRTKQDVMRDTFLRFRRIAMQRVKPGVLQRGKREFG